MAGWDDDDELLDAMFDDDDDVVDPVSIVASTAAATATAATTGSNDATNKDDGGDDDDDAVDVNNAVEGGWDDDLDLDGLSSVDNGNADDEVGGEEEEGGTMVQTSPSLPPPMPPPPMKQQVMSQTNDNEVPIAAAIAVAGPMEKHGDNNNLDATMEKTLTMFQEHEKLMDREIETIRNDQSFAQGNQEEIIAAVSNDVNAEEEWDFDDDDDIFNEDNDSLGVEDDGGKEMVEKEPPAPLLDQVVKPAPPTSSTAPPPPASNSIRPLKHQHLNGNPFLMNDDNDEEENHGPSLITAAGSNGNENVNKINPDDGDGWSDEDFFNDDDDMLSSSKIIASVSPAAALFPPVAQHTQQQHQLLSVVQPKPLPAVQTTQRTTIAAFNPTQRKIHQMLSNYISALNDENFLTRLHQKLHLCQETSSDGAHSSSMVNAAAGDLKTYYATRPGLRKYTLGVELNRMDYELVLGNGKSTNDKDVIRSYFGVGEDGERVRHSTEGEGDGTAEEGATAEELLIRSANQSLLADMLAALTGPEEEVAAAESVGSSEDDLFARGKGDAGSAGLILSGPMLCMTSVAESCHFAVDLQCGKVEAVCLLAISVPFHPTSAAAAAVSSQDGSCDENVVVEDGRLVLARAKVSVRFRPGGEGGDCNDEPTVQYAVQSVTPLHSAGSILLQQAAVALAHDQHDPFFQKEYAKDEAESTDARDRFLLSHHLLSAADSAALLAVSRGHIDRLKGAAESSTLGFRSALRQLDDVANVRGRLGGLSGGFGLALPSAAEIEAAEKEASGGAFAGSPQLSAHEVSDDDPSRMHNYRPQPPVLPPPPPIPKQAEDAESSSSRPRPLIGGLFMSGLSRLAAAATQPDEQQHQTSWGVGGGGTGLTPPSSPPPANGITGNEYPPLNQSEEEGGPLSGGMQERNNAPRGFTGLTPLAAKQQTQRIDHFQEFAPPVSTSSSLSPAIGVTENQIDEVEEQDDDVLEDEHGWSEDEFDFEDENGRDHFGDGEEACSEETEIEKQDSNPPVMYGTKLAPFCEAHESKEETIPTLDCRHHATEGTEAILPIPPPPPPLPSQQQRTFDEEFVFVLKEKIDAECREMKETRRMKRWTPLREDDVLRRKLMEVMISQINS